MSISRLFLSLVAIAAACGHKNSTNDRAPPTLPAPAAGPDLTQVDDVLPIIRDTAELPDDFGFTATYASFGPVWTQTRDGETVVRVRKNRIQLRKSHDRDIIDCRFDEKTLPIAHRILDGREQKSDTFTLLSCIIMKQITWPVANLEALCAAHGCVDEKVGEFETTRVTMDKPLWIEKTTRLRIQADTELLMLKKTSAAPADQVFDFQLEP